MKVNTLTITINKSASDVFAFTTDPANTPRWIDSVVEEVTNTPPQLGTIYRNRGASGDWDEYEMTEYVEHEAFTLTRAGGNFHVRYSFEPTDDGGCYFTYCEWVDKGELAEVFGMGAMETLRRVMEEA